ncbi:hypothetical protein H9Q74_014568, partial [Fusarium xylarioides]
PASSTESSAAPFSLASPDLAETTPNPTPVALGPLLPPLPGTVPTTGALLVSSKPRAQPATSLPNGS